ncbi:MAG TPA: hypothetical protein DCY74_03905 [Clostridiales bacterium]|nr:hypothetical protein [Clostridiales bacterium]
MKPHIKLLVVVSCVCAIISACIGVFYSFDGTARTVTNIYGQEVNLFGDGIYANDTIMKAGATKGTDIVIIIASSLLLYVVLFLSRKKYASFLQSGLLSLILYASTCLIMGVSFNRLFLLYTLQFGSTLFAFILSMTELLQSQSFDDALYEKRLTGTAIFILIGGCSALVWMMFIIPSVVLGKPMEIIDTYTTEPTFALDLAIIFPSSLFCGIALFKKKAIAYQLAPVLLTLLTGVGICVILQTVFQSSLGVVLGAGPLFGLVISFVILGTIALLLNIKLLKRTGGA